MTFHGSADLRGDLRLASRRLRGSPLLSLALVGILTLGTTAAGVAFAVVRGYLYRPLPVPEADRLAYVIAAPSRDPVLDGPDLRGVDWTIAAGSFDGSIAWDLDGFTLVDGDTPEYVNGSWVTPGWFDLLGVRAVRGRLFTPDEYVVNNRVAVLDEELWRRRFGAADTVVGSTVRMHSTDRPNEEELVTIVGIVAPPAWRVNRFHAVLRPLGAPRQPSLVRLPPGMTVVEGASVLTNAVKAQVDVENHDWRMSLVPALDEHVHRVRPTLYALLAIAALLLVLSTASAGAMLLARGDARAYELAIRRALGAAPSAIVRQLVAEAGLVWSIAAGLALVLTAWLVGPAAIQVERFGSIVLPGGLGSARLDLAVGAIVLGASLLPFMALGVAPLVRSLAGRGATPSLTTRITSSSGASVARRALVVVQVTMAVGLLIVAALLGESARAMADAPLGFAPERLFKGNLLLPRTRYADAPSRAAAVGEILARVRALPGVESAAAVLPHPFRGTQFSEIECEGCGRSLERPLLATVQTITPTYFGDLRIPHLAGRTFDERDVAGAGNVAVISAALARELGEPAEAIGRRVRTEGADAPWLQIVGVVGDVRKTFGDTLYPDLYVPYAQHPRAYFALLVRTAGAPLPMETAIRQAVAAGDPALALSDVESMEALVAEQRGPQVILASFAGSAATVALVLTLGALYAVIAYLTSRRRREFAIRSALGARPLAITRLVMSDGLRLTMIGVMAGVALASAGTTLLRAHLFEMAGVEWRTYVWCSAAVLLVAAGAVLSPALRAASRPASEVLRESE